MAYEAETIAYSQKIFYYLLCHGALSDLDAGANELYRAYVEHEEVMNLVRLPTAGVNVMEHASI